MARGRLSAIVAAAGVLAALSGAGCGKPVLRVADASLGDYYTPEEYKRLREEQRLEYCEELAEQDEIYLEEIADARTALERFERRAATANADTDSLSRLADSLETAVAALRGRPAPPAPAVAGGGTTITVRPGDSLWRISARDAVYGDGRRWNELYRANRDRIRDADRIYPGQELHVPR